MSVRLRKIVKFGGIETARWIGSEARSLSRRFGAGDRPRRLAIVSDRQAWCSEQQLHPIFKYRDILEREHGITILHMYLDQTGIFPRISLGLFDAVMLKLSYRVDEARASDIARRIKAAIGSTPLIYMDGDDDVCIQWPEVIMAADIYVKCHAFADRGDYTKQYLGKSNLHDYAIREHGHVLGYLDYTAPGDTPIVIDRSGVVPANDLGKIVVGWNIAMAEDILALWERIGNDAPPEKKIDCTFRGSVKRDTITGYMRGAAVSHLERLRDRFDVTVSAKHVSKQEYYQELLDSRICVSPFGFGELCWRDFEAVLCRTMLIKPDMGHIETYPNIFQPYVTYVPVKWDLSDLEDTCQYYLEHASEREAIAARAFAVLDDYYRSFGFGKAFGDILDRARAIQRS